jgi:hypothetical protein
MTTLYEKDFAIFDRKQFAFKQLKENHTEEELSQVKASFKDVWDKWKHLQQNIYQELTSNYFAQPKVESWTNGWNLRSHYWSAYRGAHRQNENACIGVLLNKKQLQVYLMFQEYKSGTRQGTKEQYNQLLAYLPKWSEQVDVSDYYIWPQQEHELMDHLPLKNYLADAQVQQRFQDEVNQQTFQLGKLFFRAELPDVEGQIIQVFNELTQLYRLLEEITD